MATTQQTQSARRTASKPRAAGRTQQASTARTSTNRSTANRTSTARTSAARSGTNRSSSVKSGAAKKSIGVSPVRNRTAPRKQGTSAVTRTRTGTLKTRAELYELARRRDLPGRSTMGRDELARRLGER